MHLPNMDCSSTAPSWHVMYYVPRNAFLLLGLHMSLYWETAYDGAGVRERFLDTYLRSRCMTLTLGLHSTIQPLGWDLCSRCYKVTLSRGEYIHTERCWGQSHPPSSLRLLKESSSWQLFRVCEWDFTHHLQHFPCKRPILWYNKTQWDRWHPITATADHLGDSVSLCPWEWSRWLANKMPCSLQSDQNELLSSNNQWYSIKLNKKYI